MFVAALNPWHWSGHTDEVLVALGTTGAVIVALGIALGGGVFRTFRDWRRRPLLTLTHDPKTDIARETITVGGKVQQVPSPYVRIGVYNPPGHRAAEDVEVLVAAVRAIAPPEGTEDEWFGNGWTSRNYGPLGWTHSNPPSLRIGPGVLRTVDLGFLLAIEENGNPLAFQRFMLGLTTRPGSGVDQLHPGSYELTLAVTGSNADARYFRLSFQFDHWTPFEADAEQLQITNGPLLTDPPRIT